MGPIWIFICCKTHSNALFRARNESCVMDVINHKIHLKMLLVLRNLFTLVNKLSFVPRNVLCNDMASQQFFFKQIQENFSYNEAQWSLWNWKILWIVEEHLLPALDTQYEFFSNNNWLHCITAKICLFFGFFTFEMTQRKTPRNTELCAHLPSGFV